MPFREGLGIGFLQDSCLPWTRPNLEERGRNEPEREKSAPQRKAFQWYRTDAFSPNSNRMRSEGPVPIFFFFFVCLLTSACAFPRAGKGWERNRCCVRALWKRLFQISGFTRNRSGSFSFRKRDLEADVVAGRPAEFCSREPQEG